MTHDSGGTPWVGRTLPAAAFGGDAGQPDPGLTAALLRWAREPAVEAGVVAALAEARVFVAVVALAGEAAEMGLITVTRSDGRRSLPVFSSPATLTRWRPEARPVPTPAGRAALSAVAEGCDLLELDPAGPVRYLVRRPAVWCLGQGRPWTPSYADAAVQHEVDQICVRQELQGRCQPGEMAELRVVLGLPPGLAPGEVDRVVAEFSAALARSQVIADAVDSVELRVVPAA